MRKIFNKLILLIVAITTCSVFFSSCKEDELPTATRLFRPILAEDNVVAALDADTIPFISLKWDKYSGANQYVVKVIASDASDSVTITTDSTACVFKNLKFDKEYNIKIHSLNTANSLQSKDFVTNAITPDFPTELVNVSSSNIIDTQVRIIWNTTDKGLATVYDTLKIYNISNDSLEVSAAITSGDLIAGQKIIKKLQPKTKYRIEAYNAGKYKGKKLFTTVSAESYQGLIYDLRGMSDADSYKYFSVVSGSIYANTIDSLVKTNPDQTITFVLQGGVTYRLPGLVVPSTSGKIKFVTGLSLNGNASFAVSGNFIPGTSAAPATIGGFDFQKIFFTDAPLESKGRNADANYAGTYLFNTSIVNSEIKSINFNNCTVKYKRGVIRIQSAAKVDSVLINNCVFDSIAGYGITNADNADAQISYIAVSNSTFSNCDKLFVNTKPTTHPVSQFSADYCTFVYCSAADKSTLFDFNGCTVNTFTINYCLFGRVGTLRGGVLTNGVYGWRALASPNCSDCYFTTDYKNALGVDLVTPTNPIAGTVITTDTPGSFVSPAVSNFKILSGDVYSLLKKYKYPGDPRWY